jgi:hypothetical protein
LTTTESGSLRPAFEHDPFAVDDELWPDATWDPAGVHVPRVRASAGLRFFGGLLIAIALSTVLWLLIGATATLIYSQLAQ